MESPPQPTAFRFDDVLVEVDQFRVKKAGRQVSLEPKAFETLLFLVQRRGRLVTKDEILDGVWTDTFVTPNVLTRVMTLIRRALGDEAHGSRYIETVPTRGYRFVAEVEELSRKEAPESRPSTGPVAILPFKRLEAERDDQDYYLAIGLADTLITKLAGVDGLSVTPTSAALRWGVLGEDPVHAGRELKAAFVLDGTLHRAGNRLRVNAQFLRVKDGQLVWADAFDGHFQSIFDLEDALAMRIVEKLKINLSQTEKEMFTRRHAEDSEAYRRYLQGTFHLFRFTPGDIGKSIQCFEAAISRQPDYALAHSGLAFAHFISAQAGVRDAIGRAEEAALRALELDPAISEAHAVLGALRFWSKRDVPGAEAAFQASLGFPIRTAAPCHYYGWFLTAMGRFREAESQLARALEMDPFSTVINVDQGIPFFFSKRYDEARERYQKVADLEPGYWYARLRLGEVQEALGHYTSAADSFESAASLGCPDSSPLLLLARCRALSGKTVQAKRLLKSETSGQRPFSAYYAALAHLALGSPDHALRWLEQARHGGDRWLGWMLVDPRLDPLRGDARFQDLLVHAGFPAVAVSDLPKSGADEVEPQTE